MPSNNFFIDSREKKPTQQLMNATAGPGMVLKLNSADFVFYDKDNHSLGIERKMAADLLGSLTSKMANGQKRLIDQLSRMKADYTHRMLLIEGHFDYNVINRCLIVGNRQTEWNSGSLLAILWKLQVKEGLVIVHTVDMFDTANWLRVLHNRADRGCILP